MTKRTRVFLFVSVGILVLGLGTGLVAAYMGGLQNLVLIGSDGPEELAYVPADAQMVAYADVHTIANSAVRKKVREARTGIDVERDVDHVVASSLGTSGADKGNMPLVLARGRFDAVRIEGAMREQGGQVADYRGTRVVAQPSNERPAVAFVEPGLIAFGPIDSVHRVIDTKLSRGGSIKGNADVMRLVREVKNGNVWAVARFDALASRAPIPPDLAGRLPAITWFSASSNVDDGIRGTVRAEARDDQAAQDLREVIRGFMALARMQAGNKAEVGAFINSLQLSGQGKTVTLAFAVPPEMLDVLAMMRKQRPNGQAAPPDAPGRARVPQRPRSGA
jgi:hypothetical protein